VLWVLHRHFRVLWMTREEILVVFFENMALALTSLVDELAHSFS